MSLSTHGGHPRNAACWGMRDYSAEAEILFRCSADRYGLKADVDRSAPVEVLWRFPVQDRLSVPIVLALQNNDELNFGVEEFWSYFWPFPEKAAQFEEIVDAWVLAKARIVTRAFGEELQLWSHGRWTAVYGAGRIWPKLKAGKIIQNSAGEEISRTD
jgi:hypothetical protein